MPISVRGTEMMVRLTASDFYTFFRPSRCENRIYLKKIGKEEAPLGPYEEVLFRLGERHEKCHLASFPGEGHLNSENRGSERRYYRRRESYIKRS